MPKEKFLTNRQKEFCKLICEGIYSNGECARRAGYSHSQAHKTASLLLNGKDFPLVTEHLKELREERERKYGVTLIGQLKRLHELSRGAEDRIEDAQGFAMATFGKIRFDMVGQLKDSKIGTVRQLADLLGEDAVDPGQFTADLIKTTETKATTKTPAIARPTFVF